MTITRRAAYFVNSTVGKLCRVDPTTGAAQAIDVGSYSVAAGDELLLTGRTLYLEAARAERLPLAALSRTGRVGQASLASMDYSVDSFYGTAQELPFRSLDRLARWLAGEQMLNEGD